MSSEWNPDLYLTFKKERTQPSIDLVNRINIDNPDNILDVGCGPGNSTLVLKQKWPNAKIIGIDNSKQMIDKAITDFPGGTWRQCDASQLNEYGEYDIVFSNAVLQWLPNHETLIPNLFKLTRKGGALAVQVPQNQDSEINKALLRSSQKNDYKNYVKDTWQLLNYQTKEYYYEILAALSGEVYIWETTYIHILEKHEDLINWYKSTGMRPFLDRLPNEELKLNFEQDMLDLCTQNYPLQSDGRLIFPFNRLFFIAYNKDI